MPIFYFAYGSNMLAERLRWRCSSARLVGAAHLPDFQLGFSKIGRDGSGKATLEVPSRPNCFVHGVVFELARDDLIELDRIEGRGRGYERLETVDVISTAGRRQISVTTYLAEDHHTDQNLRPFDWYLALVVRGAERAGLPADYCRWLAATPAQADPEPDRKTRQEALAILAVGNGRLSGQG